MKHTDIITKLNLEQKCALLSGAETFKTRGMPEHGIPQIWLSDGPHGLRKQAGESDHLGLNPSVPATCFPTASAVANSWDAALGEEIGAALGEEAAAQEVSVVLGPGLNMKRNPLCGRSFEYFSEDPYLAGKLAAGYIRGIQSKGVAACPKHFAVNSQETRRMASDSIVDERTLREIYLTGFEIAVKEGHVRSIMTSYNPLNGYWTASNYDLVTTILRGQWCYTGIVMSDWWAEGNDRDGAGSTKHVAAMVRAQNDVFMVVTDPEHNSGSDDLAVALTEGRLIRGELQRSAANICRFLLQTPAFRRGIGRTTALDAQLEAMAEQDMQQAAQNGQPLTLHGGVSIDPAAIDNGYRRTTAFCVMVEQGGAYTLHLRCRAMPGNSPLAQIPVSIFAGRVFVKIITITGAQTDWCEFTAALPAVDAGEVFYLRFYFGQSGMELDAVSLDLLS